MQPVSFGHCFGWLHKGHAARGVVLMNPFGFEELCARKTFVLLAKALSARGIPVLRFDWSGTGDSLGGPLDPQQLDRWRADADAAIETLKSSSGVTDVVLVGLRLGSYLAAEAAGRRTDVSRVVLLAPPASGKAWLREASAFARIIGTSDETTPDFDGLEIAGFRLSAETCEAIRSLQWTALPASPAPQVDIFTTAAGGSDRIVQCMQVFGASVSQETFQGYAEMMCDPTASQTPHALVAQLANRISADAPIAENPRQIAAFAPLAGHGFSETAMQIDAGTQKMSGILCHPLNRAPGNEAVILLNAGAIHHTGWGRMYVDLSRRLARHGVATLRLDLPGIGDSAAPDDPAIASLYDHKMNAEVSQAISWLKSRGYRHITLAGACSGAYQAFHAAQHDTRVDALVLLNQLCFVWGRSYSMQMAAWQATKSRSVQIQMANGQQSTTLDSARTLARLMPIAKKLAKGSLSALMSLQTFAANTLAHEKPVEAAFLKLSTRGARVLLAYSAGDAGLDELERHLGPGGVNATSLPGIKKLIIENADHMLTPLRAREIFADRLVAFLDEAKPDERRHTGARPETIIARAVSA